MGKVLAMVVVRLATSFIRVSLVLAVAYLAAFGFLKKPLFFEVVLGASRKDEFFAAVDTDEKFGAMCSGAQLVSSRSGLGGWICVSLCHFSPRGLDCEKFLLAF